MSNVLRIPIIIFSTIPNNSIIPVMPQKVICDSLILVAYNHMGVGHYDAVVPKPQPNDKSKKQSKEPHCRCGVNGDEPSCVNTTVIVNVTNSKSLALRNVNVKIVLIPLAEE